jgi:serine/threonine protein kinase
MGNIAMTNESDGASIIVSPGRLLGSGAQSKVFGCAQCTTKFIKKFDLESSFQVELDSLRILKNVSGVPDLIAVSQNSLALVATPVGTPLRHCDNFVLLSQVACSLVNTLHATHLRNIVHRDIGPSNIIVQETRGILIDWATSTEATIEAIYQGSNIFASNFVLQKCIASPPVVLTYEKYMDLEGLVKTMFFVMYRDLITPVFTFKGDFVKTLEFWQGCEQKHDRLLELLTAARNCDYEGLIKLFTI